MTASAQPSQDYLPHTNPVGRPTSYSPTVLLTTIQYINGGYLTSGDVVPVVAGLAVELGVGKSTINVWATEHVEFQATLELLKATQERLLLSGGLKDQFNSNICKLMLATNHGYSDKTLVESHSTLELIDSTGSDAARRVLFAMQFAQQAITDQSTQLPAISTDSKINATPNKP